MFFLNISNLMSEAAKDEKMNNNKKLRPAARTRSDVYKVSEARTSLCLLEMFFIVCVLKKTKKNQ